LRPERLVVHQHLLTALALRRQVRLWIQEPGTGEIETTKMGIYRLALRDRAWVFAGRSSRHCRVVLVPVRHVDRVELTADSYAVPPRFDLDRFVARTVAERGR
jgi:hypothetical protein